MDEQIKWKNDNSEEVQNHRKLKNELKRTPDKAKKEYHERANDKIVEFCRTGFMI